MSLLHSQASLSFLYHHSPLSQVLTEQTGAQLLLNEGHLDRILPVKYPQQPTDQQKKKTERH